MSIGRLVSSSRSSRRVSGDSELIRSSDRSARTSTPRHSSAAPAAAAARPSVRAAKCTPIRAPSWRLVQCRRPISTIARYRHTATMPRK
ncbi:MAG: hypothetical protein EBX36_01610 [Planctomycetia bacterium]|nr:hypothetical protein [Planctomycetia bacterium]